MYQKTKLRHSFTMNILLKKYYFIQNLENNF